MKKYLVALSLFLSSLNALAIGPESNVDIEENEAYFNYDDEDYICSESTCSLVAMLLGAFGLA